MSNVNQVQGAAYASPIAETQSAAAPANQESWFGSALSQAAVQAAVEAPVLTPSVAQGLMYRSMTTGVPNAEMEQYGGYGAVKAMFDAGGGGYSLDAIPASQRQQLAQQVASSSVGNMSLLASEHMSLLPSAMYEMARNGIDQASINQIYQRVQEGQSGAGSLKTVPGGATVGLTPSIAQSLMQRSMTAGVHKSEMDLYGGYDAVKAAYDAASGSYSTDAIPNQQKQQLAMQVAATGVGNFTLPASSGVSVGAAAIQAMKDNGIDLGTIDSITKSLAEVVSQGQPTTDVAAPFVDTSSYIDTFMGSQSASA